MKIIIIEDEELAAERISGLINEIDPSIEILEVLTSIKDSVKWLNNNNQPDLMFVDIQLSDGLSFSIFETVEVNIPIIFTTAYDQYAIKAFKFNSIDYLLKPIRKEELTASLSKYKKVKPSSFFDFEELLRQMRPEEVSYKKRFLIQYGQKIKKVEVEEIAYFYAMEKNVFLVTHQNAQYPVDYSLDKLQDMLDPGKFFRINRKIIISMDAIKNLHPWSRSRIKIDLTPQPPKFIEPLVSVERASDFKEWLDK